MKHGPLPSHLIEPAVSMPLSAAACYPLATSAPTKRFALPRDFQMTSRELCSDKKTFFQHLTYRSLLLSTTRISVLQITQAVTSYLTDQLKHEADLEEQLAEGKISELELEIQNNEWDDNEWAEIRKTLPERLKTALIKYHALMIIMRCYEKLISSFADKRLMDKLTKDPFKSAVRKTRRIESGEDKPDQFSRQMFETCLYSNCVSFLADYTVQQAILAFGYYMYVKKDRKLNHLKRDEDHLALFSNSASTSLDSELFVDPDEDDILKGNVNGDEFGIEPDMKKESKKKSSRDLSSFNSDQVGGLLLSFMYKSSQLMVTRAVSLVMASVGGTFGSMLKPGWGTLFGTQLGDACVGVLLDD